MYIFEWRNAYAHKRRKKMVAREVSMVHPSMPRYLECSEVPITFARLDHPNFIPKLGTYPLVSKPTINDIRLNKVMINGGSCFNILFVKTFYWMGISRSIMKPSSVLFHSVIPGTSSLLVQQATLLVTFATQENYRTEYIEFAMDNLYPMYQAILRMPTMEKFMVIPHYI